MKSELLEKFNKGVSKNLAKELGYSNVMQIPTLKKIVVSSGVGGFKDSREMLESFAEDLSSITGQKTSARKARLSEAGFKVRQGDLVGYMVTLRGVRMWNFLDKVINIVLPRTKGFWGVEDKSFDGRGSYSLGIKEHSVFPEINPNVVKTSRSLGVTIVTSARNDKECMALLKAIGMPFRKDQHNG